VLSLSVAAPAYADPAFGPGNNGLLLDDLTGVLRDLELVRVVFGIPGERAASMDLPVAEAGGSVYVQASLCGWLHQPRQMPTQRLSPWAHGVRSAAGVRHVVRTGELHAGLKRLPLAVRLSTRSMRTFRWPFRVCYTIPRERVPVARPILIRRTATPDLRCCRDCARDPYHARSAGRACPPLYLREPLTLQAGPVTYANQRAVGLQC
jgi:hypothetical protein